MQRRRQAVHDHFACHQATEGRGCNFKGSEIIEHGLGDGVGDFIGNFGRGYDGRFRAKGGDIDSLPGYMPPE